MKVLHTIMMIFGLLYSLRNYINVFLILLFISLLISSIVKKNKKKSIIFSVSIILCSAFLFLGAYNANVRDTYEKSKIKVDDMNRLCAGLVDQQYSPYNFLYKYQLPYENSTQKALPKSREELMKEKHSDIPVDLKTLLFVDVEFNKGAKRMLTLGSGSGTNRLRGSIWEFDSEEAAEKYIAELFEVEKKWAVRREKNGVSVKEDITQLTIHEKTDTYQYFIFPTCFKSRFFDLHGGDINEKSQTVLIQYKQYVIEIHENSMSENLLLPKLIQEDKLFDPEYKGVKRIKPLEEGMQE